MGSSLKLGSAGTSFYHGNVKYVTIISLIQNMLNICHKSPNILEYVCHRFHSEMLNTSTHKICELNSTGRDLGAVSEEPKEDFDVNRYISGQSPLLKDSHYYFP